jgi:hypothetical protein
MKTDSAWPSPAWVIAVTEPEQSIERRRFVLRLAALYHNPKGSLQELSRALNYSDNALHQAAVQNQGVTPECAIRLEGLLGRELFPRELFRPDIFNVA